ncbi:hypothetical protein Q5752_004526 [Cryptotrichosporon argae]
MVAVLENGSVDEPLGLDPDPTSRFRAALQALFAGYLASCLHTRADPSVAGLSTTPHWPVLRPTLHALSPVPAREDHGEEREERTLLAVLLDRNVRCNVHAGAEESRNG